MSINLKRIVHDDVSNSLTMFHILCEALMNSLHANANNITCRLLSLQDTLKEDNSEICCKLVDEIEVEDNGCGFDDDNFISFKTYRSDYKAQLGCKGIGRLSFLKLFSDVRYESY